MKTTSYSKQPLGHQTTMMFYPPVTQAAALKLGLCYTFQLLLGSDLGFRA